MVFARVRTLYPFLSRLFFSRCILLQFCANDFIVYNITFLRKIESTNLYERDTCCQGAFSRVHIEPHESQRWISSLQGSKTSVPRIKSKKIREGRGLATEGGKGEERRREGRRS